ncbi:deoxynucleoside kinase [Rhodothermus profundi]|uniref:Deoxyadenosine/deoxycytidine kinase n=1 Tax=Rhodothermus profundi TaxID=633813 RepID=A0A1M6PQ06_9BACT|nr:deoxynucleoside kinase [Rhodothermus profundi]SHK10049.1 Deoxyadenosine/deoxycytidine kinase [Rhodothermus profundi]
MGAANTIQLPDDLRYLVIEGVIGVGKTTLARLIAERFGGRLMLEEFEENPFLPRFYEDPERWAFHTQLSFLASRFRQQKQLMLRDLFHPFVVSDYAFDKDRIFARINLKGDELQLYETLYTLMEPNVPIPDLVVYLQSTPDRLLENIRRRGRPYEQRIERSYLEALCEAYDRYFFHYTKGPLLIVNAAQIDFVKNPEDLEELIRQILERRRYGGITYFNPRPARTLK